jgi:RNA-directed DNA polymerase
VAPASRRDFLGYGLIGRDEARLKLAPTSVQRLRQKVRDRMHDSRGQSVASTIEALNPLPRGWTSYFRCAQVKDVWLARRQPRRRPGQGQRSSVTSQASSNC